MQAIGLVLLLEGCADSISAGLCVMRSDGDMCLNTVSVAVVVHTVLYVALYSLIGLAVARNLIFHLFSLLCSEFYIHYSQTYEGKYKKSKKS